MVEALDRLHEPDVALLNQVDQRQAAPVVPTSDRDDEPEVRFDELVFRRLAAPRCSGDVGQVELEFSRVGERHLTFGCTGRGYRDTLVLFVNISIARRAQRANDALGVCNPQSIRVRDAHQPSEGFAQLCVFHTLLFRERYIHA